MSFADFAKLHATGVVSGAVSEVIEYLAYPSGAWQSLRAVVTRDPVDDFGAGLANRIRVFISKTDLPSVIVQQDRLRLAATGVGAEKKEFGVVRIVPGQNPGHWWLECMQ